MSAHKNYIIFPALHADSNEGGVWIKCSNMPSRRVVKIGHEKSCGTRKSIFCEVRIVDDYFVKYYKNSRQELDGKTQDFDSLGQEESNSIVMNKWYRDKLGIKEGQKCCLCIDQSSNSFCRCIWYPIRYGCMHPQIIVRFATWLSLLSLALGAISVSNIFHKDFVIFTFVFFLANLIISEILYRVSSQAK